MQNNSFAERMQFLFGDIETGGLNGRLDNGELGQEYYPIFELALIVTDADLNHIGEPLRIVVHQSEDMIARSSQWALDTHTKSGLLDEVRASTISLSQAEQMVIDHLAALGIGAYDREAKEGAVFAGNSIKLDRDFMMCQMPTLDQYLHYRQLDISGFAMGARAWNPALAEKALAGKRFDHLALNDIEDCIDEARVFKNAFRSADF